MPMRKSAVASTSANMAQRQHQQRAPPASPSVSASVSESEPEPDALLPENGPTSPVSPLAPYPPLLPTESRSRAPEFYGFVAWASTYLLFVLYLAWALLPDRAILALGVSWYPNRYACIPSCCICCTGSSRLRADASPSISAPRAQTPRTLALHALMS